MQACDFARLWQETTSLQQSNYNAILLLSRWCFCSLDGAVYQGVHVREVHGAVVESQGWTVKQMLVHPGKVCEQLVEVRGCIRQSASGAYVQVVCRGGEACSCRRVGHVCGCKLRVLAGVIKQWWVLLQAELA